MKHYEKYYRVITNGIQCIGCDDIFLVTEDEKTLDRHVETCVGLDNVMLDKRLEPTESVPWMTFDSRSNLWSCECGELNHCDDQVAYEHQKNHAFLRIVTLFKRSLNSSEDMR